MQRTIAPILAWLRPSSAPLWALYEVTYDKTPPGDRHAGHCQVCGRPMDTRSDRTIPHYELVRMPDGTNI